MPRKYEAVWPSGLRVVWHGLSWADFNRLQSQSDTRPMGLYLEVYRTCVLEGPPPDQVPAGVMVWIGRRELEQSPFTGQYQPIKNLLEAKRAQVRGNYLLLASAVISNVLHVPMETISLWDADEVFTRLAQAESLVGKPVEPADPKAPVLPSAVAARRRRGR